MPSSHTCPWWFCFAIDNAFRRVLHDPVQIVGEYVREGMRVLDLGPGMGFFAVPMAGMVGGTGSVVAADVQQAMLDGVMRRAGKAGVAGGITPYMITGQRLSLQPGFDFALAFWMFHEAPDQRRVAEELRSLVRAGGRLLMAEPTIHIGRTRFEREVSVLLSAGWRVVRFPRIRISRAVLMEVPA